MLGPLQTKIEIIAIVHADKTLGYFKIKTL